MINVAKYSVQLVRESNKRYDIDRIINSPEKVYNAMIELYDIENLCEEHMYMIALDTKLRIIGTFEISHGILSASLVHPREVFKRALLVNAASIMLVHNHPSGMLKVSPEDEQVTKRFDKAGEILGVELLDHIVMSSEGYVSMKVEGIFASND